MAEQSGDVWHHLYDNDSEREDGHEWGMSGGWQFSSAAVTLVASSTAVDILEDNAFPFCDHERKF